MRLTCVLLTTALLTGAPLATYAAELAQTVPTPLPTAPPTPASQASADQIASVAGQVAQVAIDPSISVESKTQQINSLAAQFNQLVLVWQQQTQAPPGVGLSTLPTPAPGLAIPSPSIAPARGASTPVIPVGTPGTPDASRAAQLRTQIAAITQLMGAISQDTTLPADAKSAQLQDLARQFDQLMQQLQQAG
jgi:HAMP domain-containing protein